jgi:hypothetical protein
MLATLLSTACGNIGPHTVKYQVISRTGCGYGATRRVDGELCANKASISYTNAEGGSEMEEAVLPWSKTFTVNSGAVLYVSAQIHVDSEVTVWIDVDGNEVRSSHSSGEYVIATASGRL